MHRHWINKKLLSLASLWRVTIRLSHSGCGDSFSHSSTSLVFKFDVHVTRALHQYSVTYQTWRISGGDDARVLNNTEVTWKSRNGPNRFRVPSRKDHKQVSSCFLVSNLPSVLSVPSDFIKSPWQNRLILQRLCVLILFCFSSCCYSLKDVKCSVD